MLAEKLRGRGWAVGEINGERCRRRRTRTTPLAFQTGQLDAVIFTVTESISLHRGEMPGGERERSLVVHDMRHQRSSFSRSRAAATATASGRDLLRLCRGHGGGEGRRDGDRADGGDGRAWPGDDTTFIEEIAALIEDAARLATRGPGAH